MFKNLFAMDALHGCMFNFHTYLNYIMGWKYVVDVLAKLWTVGLRRVPHSNQDTQANTLEENWVFVTNQFATSCDYLTFATIVGYIYNYLLHLVLLATIL